jgi:hypothetical protein
MFGLKFKLLNLTERVKAAADKAAFRSFSHAAASIRKDAVASIEVSPEPSPPGDPPHTRRRLLPRAMRFAVDKQGAVIGPMASMAGQVGGTHEFGGQYKGEQYPERPFMFPALERGVPRFAGQWRGSIGE